MESVHTIQRRALWRGFVFGFLACTGGSLVVFRLQEVHNGKKIETLTERIRVRDSTIAALEDSVRKSELVRDSLRKVAERSGARIQQHRTTFSIDTTIPKVTLTPGQDGDTTAMAQITRWSDGRQFLVPQFFALAYLEALAGYTDEKNLRQYTDSVTIPLKDQIIAQLFADLKDQRALTDAWKKKANPWCGTKCKVLAGATAGECLRRLVSSWIRATP